jgi:uncharacterized protein YutE (UPF0331/DUF86 family)
MVEERLKELDTILEELSRYRNLEEEDLAAQLSQRWIIERGLIAAAAIVFDIADHILAGHFGLYAETYEDSLRLLREQGVLSESLYQEVKGLGGFRNILVHEYLRIDLRLVYQHFQKALRVLPQWATAILEWMEKVSAG